MRVTPAGGAATPLTQLDPKMHTTHRWPAFLPDGIHFVYLAASHGKPRSEEGGIYVASLDGGEPKRLMTSYGSAQVVPGWILTVRDEILMATPFDEKRLALSGSPVRVASGVNFDYGTWRGVFSASSNARLVYQAEREGGRGQIEWFDINGKRLAQIGERSESYALRISPDGRRASVLEGDPNNDIWVYDLERGVRTRLTTDAQVSMSPVWSADGSELLYVSGRGATSAGDSALNRISSLGAGQAKVVARSKERIETTDWSRDGRYALVDKGNISATDIWVYPLAEPDKAFPLIETSVMAGDGRFSPDGRWVAYMFLQSSRFEVYVTPFPATGARWQVSPNGGTDPRWSPDGRTLYYLSLQNEVMAASVDGSGAEFRVKSVETLFPINVFVGPRISSGFELSPDGRRFLVNSGGDLEAPRVVLISNWTSQLPR
jgi:Tol biopolymer transport system component